MPLPHEQAAIDRARGRSRERLEEAAAVLDQVRATHPGVDDLQQLPPDVRREALRALRAFRPAGSNFGTPELALLLLLGVGLALTWFKPLRIFRCERQGAGLARCAVRERIFGLVPKAERSIDGIASASTRQRATTSQSLDSDGQTRTTTTRISELTFAGADGGALWSASESHLIGASFEQVGSEVEELASGASAGPVVRVHALWPVLLAGSLFVTMASSALGSKLGLELRDRGVLPEAGYKVVFYWGTLLMPALLYGFAWLAALLGANPPAVLAALL
jgi:hypothetical protein